MKRLFTFALVLTCSIVLSETVQTNLTADAKAAARAERRRLRGTPEQRMYGGYVTKPNSAKGKVVFLNAQKIVPLEDIRSAIDLIRESVHPEMATVDVDSVKLLNPKADIVKAGGKVGVVLADSPDLPMLVTAPENGWAIVNVAALKDGKPDGLAHRVRVELLRAFALASGCAFMSRDAVALSPHVLISEDLDLVQEGYGVFTRVHIEQELPTHGVTPWKVVAYDDACREGWAHSPTNRFQQRIWNKIHGAPKNPMKIEFDPKKGR